MPLEAIETGSTRLKDADRNFDNQAPPYLQTFLYTAESTHDAYIDIIKHSELASLVRGSSLADKMDLITRMRSADSAKNTNKKTLSDRVEFERRSTSPDPNQNSLPRSALMPGRRAKLPQLDFKSASSSSSSRSGSSSGVELIAEYTVDTKQLRTDLPGFVSHEKHMTDIDPAYLNSLEIRDLPQKLPRSVWHNCVNRAAITRASQLPAPVLYTNFLDQIKMFDGQAEMANGEDASKYINDAALLAGNVKTYVYQMSQRVKGRD